MTSCDPRFGQWPVCLLRVKKMVQHIKSVLEVTWRICYTVSRALLEEYFTTYQERYLKNILHRIKSVLKVTWRKCHNVSRASWKLLEENVTTYQERLESYLKNMSQRIKSVLKVTWRTCYTASRASWKLLEENVTTYQERLGSWLQCCNVLETQTKERYYTPQPTPTHTICKSDNSAAPRGAPSPKRTHWRMVTVPADGITSIKIHLCFQEILLSYPTIFLL